MKAALCLLLALACLSAFSRGVAATGETPGPMASGAQFIADEEPAAHAEISEPSVQEDLQQSETAEEEPQEEETPDETDVEESESDEDAEDDEDTEDAEDDEAEEAEDDKTMTGFIKVRGDKKNWINKVHPVHGLKASKEAVKKIAKPLKKKAKKAKKAPKKKKAAPKKKKAAPKKKKAAPKPKPWKAPKVDVNKIVKKHVGPRRKSFRKYKRALRRHRRSNNHRWRRAMRYLRRFKKLTRLRAKARKMRHTKKVAKLTKELNELKNGRAKRRAARQAKLKVERDAAAKKLAKCKKQSCLYARAAARAAKRAALKQRYTARRRYLQRQYQKVYNKYLVTLSKYFRKKYRIVMKEAAKTNSENVELREKLDKTLKHHKKEMTRHAHLHKLAFKRNHKLASMLRDLQAKYNALVDKYKKDMEAITLKYDTTYDKLQKERANVRHLKKVKETLTAQLAETKAESDKHRKAHATTQAKFKDLHKKHLSLQAKLKAHVAKAAADLKKAQGKIAYYRSILMAEKKKVSDLRARLADSKAKAARAARAAHAAFDRLQKKYFGLLEKYNAALRAHGAATKELNKENRALQARISSQRKVNAARSKLAATRYNRLRAELTAISKKYNELKAHSNNIKGHQDKQIATSKRLNAALKKEVSELRPARDRALREVASQKKTIAKLQADVKREKGNVVNLNKQIAALKNNHATAVRNLKKAHENKLNAQARSHTSTVRTLQNLLNQAKAKAKKCENPVEGTKLFQSSFSGWHNWFGCGSRNLKISGGALHFDGRCGRHYGPAGVTRVLAGNLPRNYRIRMVAYATRGGIPGICPVIYNNGHFVCFFFWSNHNTYISVNNREGYSTRRTGFPGWNSWKTIDAIVSGKQLAVNLDGRRMWTGSIGAMGYTKRYVGFTGHRGMYGVIKSFEVFQNQSEEEDELQVGTGIDEVTPFDDEEEEWKDPAVEDDADPSEELVDEHDVEEMLKNGKAKKVSDDKCTQDTKPDDKCEKGKSRCCILESESDGHTEWRCCAK